MLPARFYEPIFRFLTPAAALLDVVVISGAAIPASKTNVTTHWIVGFAAAGCAAFGSLAAIQHGVSTSDAPLMAMALTSIVTAVWAILRAEERSEGGRQKLVHHARLMHLHAYTNALASIYPTVAASADSGLSGFAFARQAVVTGIFVGLVGVYVVGPQTKVFRLLFEPRRGELYKSEKES